MRLSQAALLITLSGTTTTTNAAFIPGISKPKICRSKNIITKGYLDDLAELGVISNEPENETKKDLEQTSKANTNMKPEDIDRHGPGNLKDYVDFDEFDGGDGQMGVAGDGNTQLEKIGRGSTPTLANSKWNKSKVMSAKNAWGTATGYADELMKQNPDMDTARAQQLENWHNQQEVLKKGQQMKEMAESFDQVSDHDEDWRMLAKFGYERNEKFDMDELFGPATPGEEIEGTIELKGRIGQNNIHEMELKNQFMGFADFRATFTPETPMDWTITPNEGSLSANDATPFVVKFRPQGPGIAEGFLVIETEDFKKTWKVIGSTG